MPTHLTGNTSARKRHMKRIFLIGYMGSGKTTLGKTLAQSINTPFLDLDSYIENRQHKTIREIFEESGEEKFRSIEKILLHEAGDFENIIIATGGGTPCFFDNIDYMNARGTCIYLQASVDELCQRLDSCRDTRPLLRDKSKEELHDFIEKNLSSRKSYYQQAAIHFDTGTLATQHDIEEATRRLAEVIERQYEK